MTDPKFDNVTKPKHYNSHPSGIECIQVAEHYGFNIGNAIKYLWRCGLKDDETQELRKAVWYILREILKRGGDIVELLGYWQSGKYAPVPGHVRPSPIRSPMRYEVRIPNGLPEQLSDILREIIEERRKQIGKGFTESHDDDHGDGEIADAAACYITGTELHSAHVPKSVFPEDWPTFKGGDRERQLIKGITLGIAELERVRRKKNAVPQHPRGT